MSSQLNLPHGTKQKRIMKKLKVLAVYISLLLSALLTHGTVPQEFLTSTVIPIPKGKGLSVTDAANYRCIALSSIFGKKILI